MTSQFHEGQDVEVYNITHPEVAWRKAKIVKRYCVMEHEAFLVQFPDGTRAVFDETNIMTAQMECSYDHGSGGSGRLWP